MPMVPKEQAEFEAGTPYRGWFWASSATKPAEVAAPGVLTWSPDDGAELWLFGEGVAAYASSPFSGPSGPVRIFGESEPSRQRITLPAALATSVQNNIAAQAEVARGQAIRFVDSELVADQHVGEDDHWTKLIFRTSFLHEWFSITGFGGEMTFSPSRGGVQKMTVEWTPPRAQWAEIGEARIRFGLRMEASAQARSPRRSIETAMDALVQSAPPQSSNSLHDAYLRPLQDLLTVASGKPDHVVYEAALKGKRRRATILRRGARPAETPWQPHRPPLFYSRDLPDFKASLARWYDLHRAVSPTIEVFCAAQGQSFTAERLQRVASALEAYHRERREAAWKQRNKTNKTPSLRARLADLQQWSGVSLKATGMSEANQKLLVASRNYFAHLEGPNYGFSLDEVNDAMVDSTRRAEALFKAAMLRELAFSGSAADQRLLTHHRGWSIPG